MSHTKFWWGDVALNIKTYITQRQFQNMFRHNKTVI